MIDALSQFCAIHTALSLAIFGILIGSIFGALIERTGFCAMGGVADAIILSDNRRLLSWFLASAIAILGALALINLGITEFEKSRYLSSPINLIGNIIGGFIFGIGMALTGGCVSKTIVRAATGDIRAAILLGVVAFFAFITLTGVFAPMRVALVQMTSIDPTDLGAPTPALPDLMAATFALNHDALWQLTPLAIAGVIIAYAMSDSHFRRSPRQIIAGIGVGLCVTMAWAVTGLAYDELALTPNPPTSLSFVAPVGDTFEWLRRFTALDVLPRFSVALVIGTLLGAFLSATLAHRFHFTTFADTPDTLRSLGGAALMGIGGILAQGCTIGQGVSGTSTLAIGSFVSIAAMIAGSAISVCAMKRWA